MTFCNFLNIYAVAGTRGDAAAACNSICNLPKAKLAGEASVGMVLCASNAHESESESNGDGDGNGGEDDAGARKVEFVDPPESAEPGTAIVVEGVEQKFASISRMKKKKIWAAIQSELKVIARQ